MVLGYDAAPPPPFPNSILSGGVHGVYRHLDSDPDLKHHFSLKNAADAAGYYTDLGLAAFSQRYPTV